MPEFNYIARDNAGEKIVGEISAASEREAIATLAGQSLFPIKVSTETPATDVKRIKRIPAQLRATTYGQLADLLESGVPMLRALAVLKRQTNHAGLSEVLGQVHHYVEDGSTLAEAMGRFPNIFGEMVISMVRAGAEGGFLEEALSRVAEFTEAQEDLKKRTAGAVAYPLVLAAVGSMVVVVLMVFFVPKFDALFADLRQRGELPAITDWLLWTSNLVWQREFWIPWGLLVLVAMAVGVYVIWQWQLTDRGRYWRDRLKIHFPLVGGVFLSMAVARFCRVLGTLLHNGVPIVRSLEISSDATGNRVLGEAIVAASDNISAGESLAGPLASSGHFPPMIVEMIAVAEESNTLEKVLIGVADSLERRTWRQLDIVVRMLEPILLLMLAGVVLMLVIALLLPMLKMGLVAGS